MFQGGENPEGKKTTLEESQASGFATDVPVKSYDFQAPLGEFGQERESFRKLKLPLNGRDPSSLVLLAPGVTNVLNTGGGVLQGGFSFPTETGASANGGRQGSTYYLLDGIPNVDTYIQLAAPFPNADATQEFRVISNNFDARYGLRRERWSASRRSQEAIPFTEDYSNSSGTTT